MKILLIFLYSIHSIVAGPMPIVLWHGMGDTCCFALSLGGFKAYLELLIPGVYVTSLRMGDNFIEDYESGYFMSPNRQVEEALHKLTEDKNLTNGFNAIGFSQGSQFLRGLVQRHGDKLRVKNLISMGGQHQGVYGLPKCEAMEYKQCEYIRRLLNKAAYHKWVQEYLVQATYWHDPLNESEYIQNSHFLADINNERTVNRTYIDNLRKLKNFVMVKFEDDSIVQPKETEWFGFYQPGQDKKMITLQESRIYKEDRLGLRKMDRAGKLKYLSSPGDHLRFTDEWFKDKVLPYLLN